MARTKKTDLLNALFADVRSSAQKARKNLGDFAKAAVLRKLLHPVQALLEADRARRIAVRSPRQVGKSTAALLIVVLRCLEKANAEWVVIGLTRSSVKRIYWTPLQVFNEAYELGIKFHFQELTATFPNGSKIGFYGADKIDEIEKLRGGRYHGAVIDECKSYPLNLFQALLEEILEPALAGQGPGPMYLIGTPGDVLEGEFYESTCEPPILRKTANGNRWSNRHNGVVSDGTTAIWSLHTWTLQDNIHKFIRADGTTYTLWEEALEIKDSRGWGDDHPVWRREYLGQWVPADNTLVYHYHSYLHDYLPVSETRYGLPGARDSEWKTIIGWDYGKKDGTAAVVWAYSPNEPGLWEVYSEKRKPEEGQRLPMSEIATWHKELEEYYGPFEAAVGDMGGLGSMLLDTLADDHGVYIEGAKKTEKLDHIEIMNNDFDHVRIHIRAGSHLSRELRGNRWIEKSLATERRTEDPATPNDLCDAALYAFRWAMHRKAKDKEQSGPVPFTKEWFKQLAAQELAELRRIKSKNEYDDLDREWWHGN